MSVVVVGSLNWDMTVEVDRIPRPGETIGGGVLRTDTGGKGANQAVAAARLGASVAMVGRIGADEGGRALLDSLRTAGVDTSHVTVDEQLPTGTAMITVDRTGENSIAVATGANGSLTTEAVMAAGGLIKAADVMLMQLEIPMESARAAAALAPGVLIINPAPIPAGGVPGDVLALADIVVPNRTELAEITGNAVALSVVEIGEMAREIEGPRSIVVTAGADGAVLVQGDRIEVFRGEPVDVVDTTGAGDAFCGALAARVSAGDDLSAAVMYAVRASAIAVTRHGAQAAMPTLVDLDRKRDST